MPNGIRTVFLFDHALKNQHHAKQWIRIRFRLTDKTISPLTYSSFSTLMSRIASLDIGTVRIGVAISNPERTVALGYGTIHLKTCSNPYDEISRILKENEIKRVVVGWPLELDGTEGPAIRRTKQFLVMLKRTCPDIRIIPQDERLTSSAAENALQEMNTRGSNKKNLVDTMAACLILQTYLDAHSSKGSNHASLPCG